MSLNDIQPIIPPTTWSFLNKQGSLGWLEELHVILGWSFKPKEHIAVLPREGRQPRVSLTLRVYTARQAVGCSYLARSTKPRRSSGMRHNSSMITSERYVLSVYTLKSSAQLGSELGARECDFACCEVGHSYNCERFKGMAALLGNAVVGRLRSGCGIRLLGRRRSSLRLPVGGRSMRIRV